MDAQSPRDVSGLAPVAVLERESGTPSSEGSGSRNESDGIPIRDKVFCQSLAQLKRVRNFLHRESVALTQPEIDALRLGHLWAVYSDPLGRMPTEQEWEQVDRQIRAAFLHLPPERRESYLMTEIPPLIVYLPLCLLFVCFACILLPSLFGTAVWLSTLLASSYLLWSFCLGGIGSLAFVAMNALSVQDDITFDLTNVRLVSLRTIVGSLFAVVMSAPFGFREFSNFCLNLISSTQNSDPGQLQQAIWLFAPFVFGFSTSSVILILNQAIRSIQSFFGFERKAE